MGDETHFEWRLKDRDTITWMPYNKYGEVLLLGDVPWVTSPSGSVVDPYVAVFHHIEGPLVMRNWMII